MRHGCRSRGPHQPSVRHIGRSRQGGSSARVQSLPRGEEGAGRGPPSQAPLMVPQGPRRVNEGAGRVVRLASGFSMALSWCLCFSTGQAMRPRNASQWTAAWSLAWPLQREQNPQENGPVVRLG